MTSERVSNLPKAVCLISEVARIQIHAAWLESMPAVTVLTLKVV